MQPRKRSFLARMIPVLLAVAIVGYLLGASRPGASSSSGGTVLVARTAAVPDPVVLEYPVVSGWSVSSGTPPGLPGLAITQSLLLAPTGNLHSAGLIAGQIAAASSSPLPMQFLARLPAVPRAQVVSLLNTQAYRYGPLSPTGSDDELTLYVVPGATGATAMIACYAAISPAASRDLKACEQLAGKLTLQVEGESQILPPDVGYARQITALLARVDKLRQGQSVALGQQAKLVVRARGATQLAAGFGEASRSLTAIQVPPSAAWAQEAFSQGLSEARGAYLALAAAARADSRSGYEAARTRVHDAEASIATALRRYGLLGYA